MRYNTVKSDVHVITSSTGDVKNAKTLCDSEWVRKVLIRIICCVIIKANFVVVELQTMQSMNSCARPGFIVSSPMPGMPRHGVFR